MSDPEELAFLERIRARPAADGPRLIFADWLDERGDPRGEFIRVQCALARLGNDDPRRTELESREQALRDAHGSHWAEAFTDLATGYEFRRGFVESISIDARVFLRCAPELFRQSTIRRVRFIDADHCFSELIESPSLQKIRELDLCGSYLGNRGTNMLARSKHLGRLEYLNLGFNDLTDGGVRNLAAMPALARLRTLILNDNRDIGSKGVGALKDSTHLGELRTLDLSSNSLNEASARRLANNEGLPKLDQVLLHGNAIGDGGAAALAKSELLSRMLARRPVLELRDTGIGPQGARELAHSERLAVLEVLDLSDNPIGDTGLAALARSPFLKRLVRLCLQRCRLGDDGVQALAVGDWVTSLRFLDLRGNVVTDDVVENLRDAANQSDWRSRLEVIRDPVPLNATRRRYRRM